MNDSVPLALLDESQIKDLIYEVRGQKVMLDFELAKIYGYETRYFNRQVKNNIEKFPSDFMFQLTKEEIDKLVMCNFFTSRSWERNNKGGRRKLPYAFTEQGIYMLMTVLKGELATKQSITIIRTFKQMKEYIVDSNNLVSINDLFKLINNVDLNTKKINSIDNRLKNVESSIIDESNLKHFLILDGQRIEAIIAYQEIYSLAKKSIYIIDDYIDVKTLELLKVCKPNTNIMIFSDNKAKNNLNVNYIKDFRNDTGLNIVFKKNNNRFHDRYIIIDYNTKNEVMYICGSSSKDSGNKITSINKIEFSDIYHPLIEDILNNANLIIKNDSN